jgi:hypothetical protein
MLWNSKPGGDEPRLIVPPSAGDVLLAGVSSAELSLYRELGDDGRPAVGINVRLNSTVAAADAAPLLRALQRAMLAPRAGEQLDDPTDDRDSAAGEEGGAL